VGGVKEERKRRDAREAFYARAINCHFLLVPYTLWPIYLLLREKQYAVVDA
jgi:hypothetical protein